MGGRQGRKEGAIGKNEEAGRRGEEDGARDKQEEEEEEWLEERNQPGWSGRCNGRRMQRYEDVDIPVIAAGSIDLARRISCLPLRERISLGI